ncbi:hypothetical protein RO3G_06165 [Rhizopus delemar RA 99-880]|uniref:Transmembrane protein n=1 Tax=Rhizopus delemar (strain RA 99-880 / ATCC MYA-4621 / FGSC 9543 / NRRL 43880) TaxID=246409 RepID=I1BZ30_RHIO9|nr:hypothetical protein RO3G_06165 [Rhizopus delemar RA 99-880]|eukprot:EIE81460.1 hypothetical protein RO3G_06165 [Rhizopus delemar RA 99-880]
MLLLSLKRSNAPLKKFQILVKYSTLPKQAAGKFTSNKLITEPSNTKNNINEVQRTLVYIGPFAETMKRYKMTASFFGICGIIAVPGLISTGQAPMLSVALETISFWGRFKEENMWLSQLKYKSTTKGLVWQQNTGSKHIFTLEREIIEADPYLNALSKRIQRKQV